MENNKNSTFSLYIKPVLVLFILTALTSTMLAYINSLTAPIIAENVKKVEDLARIEVLDGAKSFSKVEISSDIIEKTHAVEAYKENNGKGYVITVKTKGYSGFFPVMVGFHDDMSISKIKLLDNEETPGIGKKAEKESYTSMFIGVKSGEVEEKVIPIAGATITSKAVMLAADNAFLVLKDIKEGN